MLFKSTSIFPHGFVYAYELTNIKYYQQQSVMKTESCQSFPGRPELATHEPTLLATRNPNDSMIHQNLCPLPDNKDNQ